jgi:hypothetical protein
MSLRVAEGVFLTAGFTSWAGEGKSKQVNASSEARFQSGGILADQAWKVSVSRRLFNQRFQFKNIVL